jgi:predicted NUDIX family phosphoesterase
VKPDEAVLGIPMAHFQEWGAFVGFRPTTPTELTKLLDPRQFQFRFRSQCETDPEFLQLIPYVLLRSGDQLFHYRRGSAGTETRLQSLRSIGIGGHISTEDAAGGSDPYRAGLEREVREEVVIAPVLREHCLGLIHDPRTLVGQVHLGIAHLWELAEPAAHPRELALVEASWSPFSQLCEEAEEFETWSQFLLQHMALDSRVE